MTHDDRLFGPNRVVTIFKAEQPEPYQRAMNERTVTAGTLTYKGRSWQVGKGWSAGAELGSYVEIRPKLEISEDRERPTSPRPAVTVLRQPNEPDC